MITHYEILFSISIEHNFYNASVSKDFTLVPTAACKKLLLNYDLLYKPTPSGANIICRKTGTPKEAIRKIIRSAKFTFALILNNHSILSASTLTESPIATFSGRKSYYFSNLTAATGVIDQGLNAQQQVVLSNDPKVSASDSISLLPAQFNLKVDPAQHSKINVMAFGEGQVAQQISSQMIAAGMDQVALSLPQSGHYQIQWIGLPLRNEEIYASTTQLYSSLFGIIEIYKNAAIDYNTPIKYILPFERKAQVWKYFIIDHSETIVEEAVDGSLNIGIEYPNLPAGEAVYPNGITFSHIKAVDQSDDEKLTLASYAPKKAYLFKSSEDLPSFERTLPNIMLKKTDAPEKVIFKDLPNPSLNALKPEIFINI